MGGTICCLIVLILSLYIYIYSLRLVTWLETNCMIIPLDVLVCIFVVVVVALRLDDWTSLSLYPEVKYSTGHYGL